MWQRAHSSDSLYGALANASSGNTSARRPLPKWKACSSESTTRRFWSARTTSRSATTLNAAPRPPTSGPPSSATASTSTTSRSTSSRRNPDASNPARTSLHGRASGHGTANVTKTRVPSGRCSSSAATDSAVDRYTGCPHWRQCRTAILANRSFR